MQVDSQSLGPFYENMTMNMSHMVCPISKFSRGGRRAKWQRNYKHLCSSIKNTWILISQNDNSLRAPSLGKVCRKLNQNRNMELKNRESNPMVIIVIN